MKHITLTKGFVAIVDDEDFEFVSQWKWNSHPNKAGQIYAARLQRISKNKRIRIFMHHLIHGRKDGFIVDHENGNSLDNRKNNLRHANRSQNMWNRKPNIKSKSKYKGVSWHKQHRKWIAAIQVNKKKHHIGLFRDEHEAGRAYAERARLEFGEFNRECA
jgi:HNH endonuclease